MAYSEKKWVEADRTILFVDESAIYLLPSVVRTWAPRGERPILREWVSRDHLSSIAGISQTGELYLLHQTEAYDADDVVGFLKHLLTETKGKIGIVWDGISIHRGEKVKQFLQDGGAERIELVMLPAYSPNLNPVEGVWSYLKGVLLPNRTCCSLAQLKPLFTDAVARLRSRPDIIQACFQQPGCY